MNIKEAIKEAEIQFDVYESMMLYNKDFEPKNDNSNYERQIEFLKIAIEALEKQVPKKPSQDSVGLYYFPTCPNCHKELESYDHHCECGQALNWE